MKKVIALLVAGFCAGLSLPAQTNLWRSTEHTLARLDGTNVLWQINAAPTEGKPYFHPLATPGGTLLTDLRPPDHPWHRSLWFSWKFINGLNYWEEDRQTHRSEGATELVEQKLQPHDDGSAMLKFSLSYHPWNAPAVLTEQRTIEVSAPTNGCYEINWTSEFTAVTNVSLTRTPPPGEPDGKSYGGYAGLSLRLNKAMCGWTFSNSSGATDGMALHGKPASWFKFSAGTNLPAVTIFDDAKNLRHPSPWYVNQEMPFFSPALLFNQSLTLSPGKKLTLRYKILIIDHDAQDQNLQ
ncbi:MAG: PmoA family protein [Limisphaerales bacterium]